MSDNNVRIDPKKVHEAGTTILNEANTMKQALDCIKDIINNTKNYFQSEGGDEVRTKFNESAQKFEEFKKFINEYGDFLKSYSEGHDKLDQEIMDSAHKFPVL